MLSTVVYILNGCSSNLLDTTAFESRSISGNGIIALVLLVTTFVGIAILRIAINNAHNAHVSSNKMVKIPSFSVYVRSFIGFYSLYWVIMNITLDARFAHLFYLLFFAIMATTLCIWIDETADHRTSTHKIDRLVHSSLLNVVLMALSCIVCIKLWSIITAMIVTYSANALSLGSSCLQQLPAIGMSALVFSAGLIIIAWAFGAFYKQISENTDKNSL